MDDFGSDFITITDEDGVEYELEILSELDYQGAHYLAVVPATSSSGSSSSGLVAGTTAR